MIRDYSHSRFKAEGFSKIVSRLISGVYDIYTWPAG